jgi:hypothetical protein
VGPTSQTGPHGYLPHGTPRPSLLPCLRFERQRRTDSRPPPSHSRLAGDRPPPLPSMSRPSQPRFPLPFPSLLWQGSRCAPCFCSPSTTQHQPRVNRATTFSMKWQCRLSTSPVQSTIERDESRAAAAADHILG